MTRDSDAHRLGKGAMAEGAMAEGDGKAVHTFKITIGSHEFKWQDNVVLRIKSADLS